MSGNVFRGLHNLKHIYLRSNQCMKEDFLSEDAIKKLPEIVSKNCGFCEKISDLTNCEIRKEFKESERNIIQQIKSEQSSKVEIARLEGKLSACVQIQKINEKLEKQTAATCTAKAESLRIQMSLIAQENSKLHAEIEALKAEILDRKVGIKTLKTKLGMFENNS